MLKFWVFGVCVCVCNGFRVSLMEIMNVLLDVKVLGFWSLLTLSFF